MIGPPRCLGLTCSSRQAAEGRVDHDDILDRLVVAAADRGGQVLSGQLAKHRLKMKSARGIVPFLIDLGRDLDRLGGVVDGQLDFLDGLILQADQYREPAGQSSS